MSTPTRDELKAHQKAFKTFLKETESLRPDLYRYCRHLSASPWDAEDLVQETLLRCYAQLGCTYFQINNWRAYLFRTASNLWMNEQRRAGRVQPCEGIAEYPDEAPPKLGDEVRSALALLLRHLAPQERAALVLHEVFDVPAAEIATYLQTTVGAVKHALHRAREKVARAAPQQEMFAEPGPCPKVLQEFVAAFNAHDLEKVVALLREDATASVVGLVEEHDRQMIRDGSLPHTIGGKTFAEAVPYRGEWIVLLGSRAENSEALDGVGDVLRFQLGGDKIVDFKYYFFTQDFLQEVLGELKRKPDLCGCYYFD
ncbi:MAG TPA: sigma-70 family RNA polymerase sigma factor [Planctomycetota bacterium]|nr:sigma-70 family RNA polymerase sigma factor [Planctomycetota bacterium]